MSTQSVDPLVMVTVDPLMVHPPLAATRTVRPDVALGATAKVIPNSAGSAGWAKSMVCGACFTVTIPGWYEIA